ncbi:MAG: NAD(+) synthase [Clostridia bacterium]
MDKKTGIRIAAASPALKLFDSEFNIRGILSAIEKAKTISADFIIFPSECLTGLTVGTLKNTKTVEAGRKAALNEILNALAASNITAYFPVNERAYLQKKSLKAYVLDSESALILKEVGIEPISSVFDALELPNIELSSNRERLLFSSTVSGARAYSEGEILASLKDASKRACAAFAFASPNIGESATGELFDSLCAIVNDGKVLAVSEPFSEDAFVFADVDIFAIERDRIYEKKPVSKRKSYLSENKSEREAECRRIVTMQAHALKKRAEHIKANGFVIGVSGGLDSALALIAAVEAARLMNKPIKSAVLGVSMPCFGSTIRTKNNAELLVKALGADFKEISIEKAVRQHFSDIGYNEELRGVTYENAQARERTQLLLSFSNMLNLLDVGTGDLSESALGFTTFGGDHMAQYSINASLPKTVIREVVALYAKDNLECQSVLNDILETPVSPELLPPEADSPSQRTEEILGDYSLHDSFIYNFVNYGCSVKELFLRAKAENPLIDEKVIMDALLVFIKRFFSQAFKRNCAPEVPNILISIAPKFFDMPSDGTNADFLREYEELLKQN